MKITLTKNPKSKPDFAKLGFGKFFSDHMLVMKYADGKWEEPEIIPYGDFRLAPSTTVLHYGQGIFEGCKAYKDGKGKITLFRVADNFRRMNKSASRLCMPELPEDIVLKSLHELLKIEKDWIPTAPGTSLYIRPAMVGTDTALGVHSSHEYLFFVILSPVGAYYAGGLTPTKIFVEDRFVRTAIGGTGEAKCMGNYAATLMAGEYAKKKGFDQVLWLDARDRKFCEEVGAMNIFFVINGVVATPELSGSILPGITRASAIQILKDNGYKVEERRISIEEIFETDKKSALDEVFGTGTAAVISPVGQITYKDKDMIVNGGQMGRITQFLYRTLTGIQTGSINDTYGWVTEVK